MADEIWNDVSQAQVERLAYIDFRTNFLGEVSRKDLMSRFGIKEAAATRDLSLYRQRVGGNIILDETRKIYVRTDRFVPAFKFSPIQVLTALSHGLGENIVNQHKSMIPCEIPARLNVPSIDILSDISRSIYLKKVVSIVYRSVTSGESEREIIPFSLVDNGLRWHVRAFDRKRKIFTDFVLTRIVKSSIVESKIKDYECLYNDIQWNRIVELELVAHPRLDHPGTIELDYGMVKGVLKINVRAALAGYVLRLWNVDCSPDHSFNSGEIYLWLRNSLSLYGVDKGVENLFLAPGYKNVE